MVSWLRSRPGATFLVAVAASLWGLDAWIRAPLAQSTAVATIVFGEHVLLVLLTLPFLGATLLAVVRLGWRHVLAAVVIGAGSSALATILFTQAFVDGHDFVTPVVLQKVQPIIAVVCAGAILGERPRRSFAFFFVPAIVGTWLMGVKHPFHPTVHGLRPTLYALGAAALWALGTVLGRYLTREMRFEHVATLRFTFGLAGSAVALLVLGAPAFASVHDSFWIAVLAVVTIATDLVRADAGRDIHRARRPGWRRLGAAAVGDPDRQGDRHRDRLADRGREGDRVGALLEPDDGRHPRPEGYGRPDQRSHPIRDDRGEDLAQEHHPRHHLDPG